MTMISSANAIAKSPNVAATLVRLSQFHGMPLLGLLEYPQASMEPSMKSITDGTHAKTVLRKHAVKSGLSAEEEIHVQVIKSF